MPVIHKQALAEQDLVNIWLYTWHEWGEAQADAYLDELERAMQLLVEQPSLGAATRGVYSCGTHS